MPKIRGHYRGYLADSSQVVPHSTYYGMQKSIKDEIKSSVKQLYDSYKSKDTRANQPYVAQKVHFVPSIPVVHAAVVVQSNHNQSNLQMFTVDYNPSNESLELTPHTNRNDTNDDIDNDNDDIVDMIDLPKLTSSTELELSAAYLTLFFYGNMTQRCFNMLLRLANITSTIQLPTSYDSLLNSILVKSNQDYIKYAKRWYCEVCYQIVEISNPNQRECRKCQSRLSMYYNLDLISQVQRIIVKYNSYLSKLDHIRRENLMDIKDGSIYQDILKTDIDGDSIKSNQAFTFLLNLDGISVAEKGNISIWPVYLVLNELPSDVRFCIDNVIIAGISYGDSKPNFDIFMKPIITELKRLEYGVTIKINNEEKDMKFFTIAGVYDKPARAALLNLVSSTGFTSCLKCIQEGESEHTRNGGTVRSFKFIHNDPTGPTRTHELYESDVREAESDKTASNGVKGRCCLSRLKYFKPTYSSCIDYMHTVLEGVMKTLFKYWFDGDSYFHYSLRNFMQEIDKRLLSMKPPSFVSTAPRSIYIWHSWRAKEFLSFIMFYAIPVFNRNMTHDMYVNLIKLVIFMEILFSRKISKSDLKVAQNIIEDFLEELIRIYDPLIMLSGTHELVHLVDCTLQFGPLNYVNCFQFEELNRKFMRFIHGKDLMGEEFIKVFTAAKSLSYLTVLPSWKRWHGHVNVLKVTNAGWIS